MAQKQVRDSRLNLIQHMREIRFRIWNKETKAWEDPFFSAIRCDGNNGDIILSTRGFYEAYAIKNKIETYVIQQFTGLSDKTGMPIYEGDILQAHFDIGVVDWRLDSFRFYTALLSEVNPASKIIGNIFENQDLIRLLDNVPPPAAEIT